MFIFFCFFFTSQEFYQDQTVSRILPHARYTTKYGAARVMVMTLKDAHAKFKDMNPSLSVGLTLFQQQRPRNVRLLGSVPTESCLCIYCTNVRYIVLSFFLCLNVVKHKNGSKVKEKKIFFS